MYVNVAFPLKIPPLTYKAPYGAPADLRGRIVRAPLMGRSIRGLVMSTSEKPEMLIKKDIRDIQEIYQNVMSTSAIAFLQWLADYYLTPVGTALRSSFFEEIASIVTKRTEELLAAGRQGNPAIIQCGASNNTAVSAICTNISLQEYRSFLYHAESSGEERSLLIA